MSTYHFYTEQFLRTDTETAWNFFSTPRNLGLITPPELDFRIITAMDDREIFEGMLIDYSLRPLFGWPVHWQTEIAAVDKPFRFIDRQAKGPYHLWEHTHTFLEKGDRTLMKDEVRYELPLGIIGRLTHRTLVRKKIEKIFIYRAKTLNRIFNHHGNNR